MVFPGNAIPTSRHWRSAQLKRELRDEEKAAQAKERELARAAQRCVPSRMAPRRRTTPPHCVALSAGPRTVRVRGCRKKDGTNDFLSPRKAKSRSAAAKVLNTPLADRPVLERPVPSGPPRRDHTRLVLYSSNTPDKLDFSRMVKCLSMEYSFAGCNNKELQDKLNEALTAARRAEAALAARLGDDKVDRTRFTGKFKSIALACHGPPHEQSSSDPFKWNVSDWIEIKTPEEMAKPSSQMSRAMRALAEAVEHHGGRPEDDGRVDIFACSLLATREGKAVFEAIEKETKTNFA
eukprot:SAG11_NODE_4579_length_1844_cov_2.286533_1_plen_292_part_10